MTPDYRAMVNSVSFWMNLYFGLSGFTRQQLDELEEHVEQICSEAITNYQPK